MDKNMWIFDINRFKNMDYKTRENIKNLIIEDVQIAINNNGYTDYITNNMINDSLYLIDILGF